MDIGYVVNIVISLIVAALFFMTYTYIEKLERVECPCSEHPDRKFIKGFSIFAVIYILITMFIHPSALVNALGVPGGFIYMALSFIFVVVFIVFFFITFRYADHLIKEKCKCSEDARREAVYYWSIIHMVLLVVFVLLPLLLIVAGGVIGTAVNGVKHVSASADQVHDIMVNPVRNVKKIPASLKASAKAASKLIRKRR